MSHDHTIHDAIARGLEDGRYTEITIQDRAAGRALHEAAADMVTLIHEEKIIGPGEMRIFPIGLSCGTTGALVLVIHEGDSHEEPATDDVTRARLERIGLVAPGADPSVVG